MAAGDSILIEIVDPVVQVCSWQREIYPGIQACLPQLHPNRETQLIVPLSPAPQPRLNGLPDGPGRAGVVLAIGLRPCTGAVLVLILASVMELIWPGALAVLALSLGTALTVAVLAVLATKAREWASAPVVHRSPLWGLAGGGVGALGGHCCRCWD